MPVEFQGSAKSIAFSPLRAPDQTQAEKEQLNQQIQWMKEDNQSQIESRRNVASGMAERNRLQINFQDQDLKTLAGMSKTLTDNLLEVQKDHRKRQFDLGFNEYWMGSGNQAEIQKYEENKAKLSVVGVATNNTAKVLAASGAEPYAISHLKSLSGDHKAGYLMAMAQDKGAGYGPWLQNLIAADNETQIDLGNGSFITPADARKGGPKAQAVAAWARGQFVRLNGLDGANLAMLNDKLIPSMRDGEARVMASITDQANRDRGDIETQQQTGIYIAGLKTNPGEAFNNINRSLASVINPETGQFYGPRGARDYAKTLLYNLVKEGREQGITLDTITAIENTADLDGKSTWGKRFPQLFIGIRNDIYKAQQTDLAMDVEAERQDSENTVKQIIQLGEQNGGFSETEITEIKNQWRAKYPTIPIPNSVGNYITKEKVADDAARKILDRKLANGQLLTQEDLRGFPPNVILDYRDKIQKSNEDIAKNPEVQSHFAAADLALKNAVTKNQYDKVPHYTLEVAKSRARQRFIEKYNTFLIGSTDKNPAKARTEAFASLMQEIEDGIPSGKDAAGTGIFAINYDKLDSGFFNLTPSGGSIAIASLQVAERNRQKWTTQIQNDPKAITNTLLIPQPDAQYLAKIASDPSLPPPASILVLTKILQDSGKKVSFWDVLEGQYNAAYPGKAFHKPDSVALIDSVSPKIRALFSTNPSSRRTQRGFATMPWSKEKVPNGYGELIEQAATKEGLDPALLAGLLHWETRGKPFDRYSFNSSSRAAGLAQIDPITQRELKVKDPYNPQEAIPAAARYLKRLIDRFGSVEIGIRAYNQGPGATEKSPGGNSKESKEYPAGVLRTAATYGYGGSGMNREALVHPALKPFMAGDITSPMDLSGRVNPVTGKVKPHTGIDLGVDHETLHFNVPVRFNSSGWDESGYGNWMEFTLPNGNTVLTGHLSQIPRGFKPGMTVSANKGVAVSGNTGRSTGPHLHFEERDTNGNIVDPSRPGGAMQFLLRS